MAPPRFLFVSADAALIGDVAWHVHEEGHDVKYHIEADSDKEIVDGFVPKSADWCADPEWADVLRAYETAWGHRMKGFQLQRKVEGVEVAVCGFFNGTEFVEPANFNFEHHLRDLLDNSAQCTERQTEIPAA